jgi:very-short-patch-repair endonuclease
MSTSRTLTPTLSRVRERGQEGGHEIDRPSSDSFSRERRKEGAQEIDQPASYSLSRLRERAGVRARARALRKGPTDAEALLWSRLRSRQIGNLKFRRQRPIGPYFADFACVEIGLVIELDGGQHAELSGNRYDQKRSDDMAALGFQTLRFWNHEVLLQTEAVLEKILQVAVTLTPTLSRLREREQENP